jgi:membrane associated rhomboid family serine protease
MLIPIGDINPRFKKPVINYILIIINISVFFLFSSREDYNKIVVEYGLIPTRLEPLTFITSIFLHGSFGHLLGNMLFLWIVGDNVEDKFGHLPYLVFYLVSGIFAGIMQVTFTPHVELLRFVPCIGASGAISGVVGAYFILFPTSKIRFFYWLFIFVGTFTMSSLFAIAIWFLFQLYMASLTSVLPYTGIAYWAHIGGFVFGAGTSLLLKSVLKTRIKRKY